MMTNEKPYILVVEDDAPVRNLITTTLESQNYKYMAAANGNQAVMSAASGSPDIILMDLGLPDMDGVDVIKKIRTWSVAPIIVISARSDDRDKVDALDIAIFSCCLALMPSAFIRVSDWRSASALCCSNTPSKASSCCFIMALPSALASCMAASLRCSIFCSNVKCVTFFLLE